jgi:UMF1 family MFS transporter
LLESSGMSDSPSSFSAVSSRPVRRGEIAAWLLYDWASSAYSTLLITVVMCYVQTVVLPGQWGAPVYAWLIAGAALLAAVLSPLLGALADANRSKRRWLAGTAFGGAAAALLMAMVPTRCPWLVLAAFFAMMVLFDLSLVPYNGFLPELTTEATINRVSAWGFAVGYLGGSIPLVLGGLLVKCGPAIGLHEPGGQLRAGIGLLGVWWGLFTLPTVLVLRDRGPTPTSRQSLAAATRSALRAVLHTIANIRAFPVLAWFLLAYLFYNDGLQTVINQGTTLAKEVLGAVEPAGPCPPNQRVLELISLVLMIQLIALPGSLVIGWLADRWGQKTTLLLCLAVLSGLCLAAMGVRARGQFWALGAVLGLVLGGTQAVSRAVVGLLSPPRRSAEFFGFFNLSGKAMSWLGPALFGAIVFWTQSARLAAVSLVGFFLMGAAIVALLNFSTGRRQALEAEPP